MLLGDCLQETAETNHDLDVRKAVAALGLDAGELPEPPPLFLKPFGAAVERLIQLDLGMEVRYESILEIA